MLIKAAFGNWFYVLLGLVWIGYSLYKGIKKSTEANEGRTVVAEEKTSVVDSFISNFTGEEEKIPFVADEKEAINKMQELQVKEHETLNSYFRFENEERKAEEENLNQATNSSYNASVTNKIEMQQTSVRKSLYRKKINFRNAIIYSEILRRPSF